MANVPISAFTVPANTVGIGATGYSLTGSASASFVDLAGTWNTSGTPTAIKLNITETGAGSNAASLLMDLQVGGASRFNIRKDGYITMADSTIAWGTTGLTLVRGSGLNMLIGSFVSVGQNGVALANGTGIAYTASASPSTAQDLFLTRRGAANLRFGAADVGATTATVTITIAAPGVVTWSSHTLSTGTPVVFTTTGALPTGIVSGTTYYAVVVDANTFQIASSVANAIAATPTVITTSGSQSGTHTGTRYNITQRLSMQSITGVTDRLGADLFIQGSQGTGNAAGGSIIFQVAPAGGSGTAQNALVAGLTLAPAGTSGAAIRMANSGSSSLPEYSWAGRTTSGFVYDPINGNRGVNYTHTGSLAVGFSTNGVYLTSLGAITWAQSSTNPLDGAVNVQATLFADAANTLALRNGGTNASPVPQAFNVYSFYAGAADYSRLSIRFVAGQVDLASEVAGTGVGSTFNLGTVHANNIAFYTSNSTRWTIGGSTGHLLAGADNTQDIGAVSATRPRSVYAGTSITPGRGVTVAGLPTPSTGMIARVTDATAPVIGATVAGGGAAYALVNYNGANWTVIGV